MSNPIADMTETAPEEMLQQEEPTQVENPVEAEPEAAPETQGLDLSDPQTRAWIHALNEEAKGYGSPAAPQMPIQGQAGSQEQMLPEGWEFMDMAEKAMFKAEAAERRAMQLETNLQQREQQVQEMIQAQQASSMVSAHISKTYGDNAGQAVSQLLQEDPGIALHYKEGNPVARKLVDAYAKLEKMGGLRDQLAMNAKPVPTAIVTQGGSEDTSASKDEQDMLDTLFSGTTPTPEQRAMALKTHRGYKK